jgi:Yip1 domain.
MTALNLPRTLTDPGDGVAAAVQGRRILWPLLALMAATAFAGAAFALRWDPAPGILQKLEMTGQLKGMPEAELTEQITTAGRLKLVTAIASGVFVTPLVVLGIAVVLAFVAWLLGKKAPFAALFTASAVGMAPVALQRALWGVVALCQLGITEQRAEHLFPSSVGAWVHAGGPKLARLLDSLDLFHLLAALLIGLGFAAATGIRRRTGLWVGLALFLAFVGVFGMGVPGLMAGGGPGHGPGPGGPGGGA